MNILLIILAVCLAVGLLFLLFLVASTYFTNPIGKPVSTKIPSGYFWGKSKSNKIYYAIAGRSFAGFSELVNVDPDSFEVLSRFYAKDKKHVYFESSPIEVDLATFYVDDYVAKDAKHVYYIDRRGDDCARALIIDGADPLIYKVMEQPSGWGQDGKAYFYKNKKLDVDYESFVYLSSAWVRDKDRLYQLTDTGVKVVGVDMAALELICDAVVSDGRKVIYSGYMQGGDDPEGLQLNMFDYRSGSAIEVISEAHIRHNDHIYYCGLLTEIDAKSFKAFTFEGRRLLAGYSKDKNYVYLYNKRLEHIDAATFAYDNDNFVDKNNHYDRAGNVITPLNGSD